MLFILYCLINKISFSCQNLDFKGVVRDFYLLPFLPFALYYGPSSSKSPVLVSLWLTFY